MHNKHFLWIINDKNLCFGKLKSYANNTQGPVTKAEDREGGGLGLEFVSRRFIDDLDLVCLEVECLHVVLVLSFLKITGLVPLSLSFNISWTQP